MTINEYLFTRWTDDCPIPASIIEQMRAAAGVPSHVDPFGIYMT